MVDRVGQQLGNYHLVRRIGEGGFADVYLGEHIHLGTRAAIKVLQMRLLEKKNIDAFHNEARMIAHLVHPHIIRVLDYGVQDWVPFLVMDYAPGGTLRQRFTGKPAQMSRLFPYITQMAAALQYAHDRRLIHRDVKPENMLLGSNGEILLSDFGFAMVVENINERNTRDMSGTAVYMAPEQLKGRPCPASDQYSLGVVIYEWLSGTRPYHGSFFEVASQQMLMPIQPLREKVPDLAQEIDYVVMKALSTEPEARYGSVKEFAQSLLLAYQASRRKRHNTAPHPGVSQPGWLPPATSGIFPRLPLEDQPSINSQSSRNNIPSATGKSPSVPPQPIKSAGPPSLNNPFGTNSLPGFSNPGFSGPASQSFKMPSARPSSIRPTSPSLPAFKGPTPPAGGSTSVPSQSMKRPTTNPSLNSMPGLNAPTSLNGLSGPTSLNGLPGSSSQRSRGTGTFPPIGSERPFPSISPSSGQIPSISAQQSTQGRMPAASPDRPTGTSLPTFGSSTPSRPYPAAQHVMNQNSLPGHITTPSPMPVSSAHQSLRSGAFPVPKPEKSLTEEEELKQLYAELDEINKASLGTKPLPQRGRSGFGASILWLILILVVVLVIGSSIGIFYFMNANHAKGGIAPATVTSTQRGDSATPAITATATQQASPTATVSTANPYAPHTGTLVISDPLSKNNYQWQEYANATTGNTCRFTGGAYHVISAGGSSSAGTCFAQNTDFTSFTYQVQMKILQAGTQFSGGGIMFRGNSQSVTYYYFELYKSGRYSLTACFGPGKGNCTVQLSGYPKQTAIVPGFNQTLGQPNTLAVVARDTTFDFYVNGQHALGPINDGNFTHGMVGVYATGGIDAGPTQMAEVVFSNIKVWRQ